MAKGKSKFRYSVQLTFVTIFFVFLIVTVGLLNFYPTVSARNAVFSAKRGSLMNQTTVMSASLSALEKLSGEGIEQVMELIGAGDFDRVMVSDQEGLILYDTNSFNRMVGKQAEIDLISSALAGKAVFASHYTGERFESRASAPVMSYGTVIGAVFLYERDTQQAAMIHSIQARVRNISIVTGLIILIIIIIFANALTRRIRELVNGMRIVREGNYNYRIRPRGHDEITELSEEFNDMTGRLQSTDELRRRFVSDASHELRTPLASIRLLSDSIIQSENMDKSTMLEFVTDIGSEAERLQRLTEKLMRLTRMDSRIDGPKEIVDMKRVAERTIHLLDPLARKRNVTIYTDLGENCTVLASEDDIYQIIFNLAENAIKYNSEGGNVFLRLQKTENDAVLTVEDTGIGIPDEDIPNIFNRFYRVDKARSRAYGGSGLGLSIVYDAVRANGGQISVEHRETVGTRFTAHFPISENRRRTNEFLADTRCNDA